MTPGRKTESIMVSHYDTGMKILRSPNFSVDHPFRATRQVFGPSVLDTEFATHVERKRSWIAQFLPSNIASAEVQEIILRSTAEGFAYAHEKNDLTTAAIYIPNRVLLLLLGLDSIDPVEHHMKLRAITDFLETNKRSEAVSEARAYLHAGPFSKNETLFAGLNSDKRINELLLFSYAAGETTYVAMKCLILLWARDPRGFSSRVDKEGTQKFLAENMRADPPLGIATRYCKVDTEINGMSFVKGDLIHVDIVSANRQCSMASEASLDFTFGSGKHSCPGHLLAKAELEAAVTHLRRLDGSAYRVEGEAGPRPMNFRDPGRISIRLKGS